MAKKSNDGEKASGIPYSRWVYIFGMENDGDLFSSLLSGIGHGEFSSPGLYKIGTTANPIRRWHQVQVHSPWDLRVFAIIPGGFELEAAIHKSLDEFRTRGEWFAMSRPTMWQVMEELDEHTLIGRETFTDLPWCDIAYEGESA